MEEGGRNLRRRRPPPSDVVEEGGRNLRRRRPPPSLLPPLPVQDGEEKGLGVAAGLRPGAGRRARRLRHAAARASAKPALGERHLRARP